MELFEDLLDTLELTARFRRSPRFAEIRRGLLEQRLEPEELLLHSLDRTGPGRGVGMLEHREGDFFEFGFEAGSVTVRWVRRPPISKQNWESLERAIADYALDEEKS